MRVAFVTHSYFPAQHYGGPPTSTHGLARALARSGCEVRVLTTNADGPGATVAMPVDVEVDVADGVRARYCPGFGATHVSPRMVSRLPAALAWADAVHLTGVYDPHVLPALALGRLLDRPLVWSTRGSLQRWPGARRQSAKTAVERLCRRAMPRRCVVHATSAEEAAEIGARLPGARVAVVPNGVDLPPYQRLEHAPGEPLRLLYLGRLHPIKGIENLIDACAALDAAGEPFSLVIAGGGDADYSRTLAARIERLGLSERVRMIGPVAGEARERAFADASLVVVPSYSENFGMVVAEALARGRPVIAARGTPWAALEEHAAGLWVDNRPAALRDAVARLRRAPLADMGERGRRWMERDYGWDEVGRRMRALFEEGGR